MQFLSVVINNIWTAIKAGQKLPCLSLIFILHLYIHSIYFHYYADSQLLSLDSIFHHADGNNNNDDDCIIPTVVLIYLISCSVLVVVACINIVGYIVLVYLYKHSVEIIFNKEVPNTISECLVSFTGIHLMLLRPLEIIYRYYTSPLRILPDIIVLGEVRCGTTSFCQHLMNLNLDDDAYYWDDKNDKNNKDSSHTSSPSFFNCQPPFCLWAHPELDNKETFYLVGHYLGYVTPRHYRMCFPLKITKWWNYFSYRIIGKKPLPFITFDGCAQYLTSPTAPYLIAEAYRQANEPPPILICCVRDPLQQALSWWKYENNAIKWGESMGLDKWNTKLRSCNYPPYTFNEAIKFSQSSFIDESYNNAQKLFTLNELKKKYEQDPGSNMKMPPWAMTWPGGQLSVFGRNSKFVENILRYENIFSECFGSDSGGESCSNNSSQNNIESDRDKGGKDKDTTFDANPSPSPMSFALRFVNVLPIEFLSNDDDTLLKNFLLTILKKVAQRRRCFYDKNKKNNITNKTENVAFEYAIKRFQEKFCDSSTDNTNNNKCKLRKIHRNATTRASGSNSCSSDDDINNSIISIGKDDASVTTVQNFFLDDKKKLTQLFARNGIIVNTNDIIRKKDS